ncbi:zinc-dependent alcohol dehydrogenase [Ammoniphilus resinae]|uniref:Threonine dehydrogenase-like Zn-dependent dehydrogenase n=1 Tax=Ammoniphilus resinae TaxID=861532 RepID=A0ABS4GLZ8_9BACL|nr:zinc-binding dehydrogenase [Ammoniphilus resinae]MBP1931290.1 threonine dehydrogenase-like Zn-dependent dehydrogenase [Ammoniphilus resinae]
MVEKVLAAVSFEGLMTEIREFEMPKVSADDGILRVEAVGVCGTDWPLYQNTKNPRILGHHVIGHVEKIGKNAAKRWGVKEGDRVTLEEYIPCGACHFCRMGEFRMCPETDLWRGSYRYGCSPISTAPALYGGYSQYMYLHPNTVLHKQPTYVPADQAALALPVSNGFEWACIDGGAGVGKTVVIQGPGQLGLSCAMAAKAAGADQVIISGLSADKDRLDVAKKIGADHTVDVQEVDLVERVHEITGGKMADLVIDCSAGGASVILSSINVVKHKGTILLGGYKHKPIPEFYSDELIKKCITMKGVRGHGYQSVEMAIEVIASGKYPLNELCTHTFSLSEVDYAMKTVAGKGAKGAISSTVLPWG